MCSNVPYVPGPFRRTYPFQHAGVAGFEGYVQNVALTILYVPNSLALTVLTGLDCLVCAAGVDSEGGEQAAEVLLDGAHETLRHR